MKKKTFLYFILGKKTITSRSQLYDTSHRAQLLTTFIQFRRTFDTTITLN